MADRPDQQPQPCLSIVRQVEPWRQMLAGGVGSTHGNATLELFDVLIVLLAAFFNPVCRSLRLIEGLSRNRWVRRQTNIDRVPRSTLSDALARFDPEQLRPLIEQLVARIPALGRRDQDLEAVTREVIAADGSMFELAGEVAWALISRQPRRQAIGRPGRMSQARLDLQLDVRRFVPVDVHVAGAEQGSEVDAVRQHLRGGVVYVADRAFVNFRFIQAVLNKGSNLVVRLRADTRFAVERQLELSRRDRDAGVIGDELGTLGSDRSDKAVGRTAAPPTQTMRRVSVRDDRNDKTVVLLTDLTDLPAFTIAALYRLRWQIELFFRWFKVFAAMDHCISFSPRGLTTQFYVAIIGTLLIHLYTGRRVSKYQLFAVQQIASGQADARDLIPWLQQMERERELEHARRARNKAAALQNGV